MMLTNHFATQILKTEEAIPVKNRFDIVNLITTEAQKEKSWNSQTRYENLSTQLLKGDISC